MAVSCEDMSLEVFYSHLQDSSIQFCHFSQCVPVILKYFLERCQQRNKVSIVNSTRITFHRWRCLNHLPIDIWFYLKDSGAVRFIISDLHTTDLPYAKGKSRSTAELEWCVILFSEEERDLWRPTGDLQNSSRSWYRRFNASIAFLKLTIKILHYK